MAICFPREEGPYGPSSVTSHINWSVTRCLINVAYLRHYMCLYQVMKTMNFLNDVANDAKSTQNPSLRHIRKVCRVNQLGKLINRIHCTRFGFLYQVYQAQLRERMLNRSTSLAMSTNVLEALPGKLDIKRHSPSILYISASLAMSTGVLEALPGKLNIKDTRLVFSISRQASRSQQMFSKPCLVILISKDTHLVFSIYMLMLSL